MKLRSHIDILMHLVTYIHFQGLDWQTHIVL